MDEKAATMFIYSSCRCFFGMPSTPIKKLINIFKAKITFALKISLNFLLLPVAGRFFSHRTGFLRSHIFHVEAIYSLICCSFISYANAVAEAFYYLFDRFSLPF